MVLGKSHKRRKKHRHLIADWLLYAIFRCVVFLLGLCPMEHNLRVARFLGRCLWRFYGRGRTRALTNLKASYPDQNAAWIEATGRRSFEQLAMLGVDVVCTPKLVRKDNWADYAVYKNVEPLKWRMQAGQGLLLVTGHYGNFEIIGYLLSLFGFNLYSVARPLDNRFVDRYIRRIREQKGQKLIDKTGASNLMTTVTQNGASLGFIADQDAGRKGVFVDFFGRPASTFKSIALLAITQNRPIAVGYSRRLGNRFFFEIGCQRIIEPHEWQDQNDPIHWITQEYTRAIESFVRDDPTQYWWVHRRWKTTSRRRRRGVV